jgi:ribose transport system substrate-binding protein
MRPILKTLSVAGFAGALVLMAGVACAKQITVGYIPTSMEYPYNVATVRGFENEAKNAGVKVVVLDLKGSVETQANDIDDLLARRVAGIGILPLDSVVAQSWIDEIASYHVPVVAVAVRVGNPNKRPLTDVYPNLTALVTTNDVLDGERAGELVATMLPQDRVAKIAVVAGAPGYAVVRNIEKGFEDALAKAGAKYKIVASQPTDWTPEKGESVCQNMLTAHPDIDLIFSQADDMAIGCARAIHATGSKAKLVASGGGSILGNKAITAGSLDGSVCVKPETEGRLAFKTLYAAVLDPKDAKKAQFTTYPLVAITKANFSECEPQW